MRTRRIGLLLTVTALVTAMLAAPASAGPPQSVFEEQATAAWMCPDDGFVPLHCINAKSLGKSNTFNIKVFDSRGPQESASTNPQADLRPCPHDEGADPAGIGEQNPTWWEFTDDFGGDSLYVCHHSGQQ